MTPEEITSIERSLAIQLPEFYRAFLLNYPADLARAFVHYSSGHQRHIARCEFNDSAAELTKINQELRLPGTPWTVDDGPWPERYFAIGHDQCGGYFAIDLRRRKEAVFYYDHETGRFAVEHASLAAFAAHLIAEALAWNAAKEAAKPAPAPPRATPPSDPNQLSLF